MKTLLFLFLLAFAIGCARAGPVEFLWDDPDNPAGTVDHYEVWLKTEGGEFTRVGSPLVMKFLTSSLPGGKYAVRVTAVSPEGLSSEPGNTVNFTVPASPKLLRIKVAIESSLNHGATWEAVSTNIIPVAE